jgi:hypothetical protein
MSPLGGGLCVHLYCIVCLCFVGAGFDAVERNIFLFVYKREENNCDEMFPTHSAAFVSFFLPFWTSGVLPEIAAKIKTPNRFKSGIQTGLSVTTDLRRKGLVGVAKSVVSVGQASLSIASFRHLSHFK